MADFVCVLRSRPLLETTFSVCNSSLQTLVLAPLQIENRRPNLVVSWKRARHETRLVR